MGMRVIVAVVSKGGENAVPAVVTALRTLQAEKGSCFALATSKAHVEESDLERLLGYYDHSMAAVGCAWSQGSPRGKHEFIKQENAALVFEGKIYSPIGVAVSDLVAEETPQDCSKLAERLLKKVEGDFALLATEPERITAARDLIGVQPLYYGENRDVAALASNRKTLWTLGVEETKCFPPGHVGIITKEGFKFQPVKALAFAEPKPIGMQKAAAKLQKLLETSVRRRVQGEKEVAVAFSGGLDSSVVAFFAKKCGANVSLIHVSLENQPETEAAQKAAIELDLPLCAYLFKEADVEAVVPRVVELVEEPDPVKVSIGVPFYFAAQKTKEAGFRVLLAGQGADELFGGYQRYVNEYVLSGDEQVRKTMFHDVVNIHESNVERDEKICGFHDVELRLPFAQMQLAEFALSLPTKLKFEKNPDSLRKLVLRKAAKNMGLSAQITGRPKKAVQYSTGTSNALKRIAKKRKLTVAEYIEELFQEQRN